MKERYFWIAIILTVIIWTGNYTYLQSKQLTEPIFLKHYYEVPLEERMPLEFFYVTNKNDPGVVNGITVNGIHFYSSQDGFMFQQEGPVYKKEYIHHQLRSFTIDMPKELLPIESDEQWLFTYFKPSFNNGIDFDHEVDIGYVNIRGERQRKPPLKFQMSGSGSDHRSLHQLSATERLKIKEIDIPMLNKYPGLVEVKVNDGQGKLTVPEKHDPDINTRDLRSNWNKVPGISLRDIELPIEIEKGDWISFHTKIDENNTMYLKFNIWIRGESTDGEDFEIPLQVWDEPYLEQKDINELIKQRGGEE
ncbi:hypothetical protein ACJROX_05410 [Pseudalkalibacillus sp. A8]|uniref:hypothetical protein n=1 Tax=Pseudalkalibacillus sp. A8 TaxID=3382641 RepID=UPI0038B5F7F0